MKRRTISLLLALVLTLTTGAALAAGDARVESVEYMGFGIIELDFSWDCDWYGSATISLADASGAEVPFEAIGGESDNAYLYASTLADGAACTLNFALGATEQSVSFEAVTGTEYNVRADGSVNPRVENERCDFCGQSGHDEDYSPERVDANNLPADPDDLARLFDIDRCERCGGIGHDDDNCPN